MLTAANDAASSINMAEMEANIQANLQAKIDAGASKTEIMAEAGAVDLSAAPANSLALMQSSASQSVVSKVLANHGIAAKAAPPVIAPVAPVALPVVAAPQAEVAVST